jgi:D-alanyl-D-alanine carboxypeptidase
MWSNLKHIGGFVIISSKTALSQLSLMAFIAFAAVATPPVCAKDGPAASLKPALPSKSAKWGWENARMTVAFLRQADNSYSTEQLSPPLNADTKLPIASLAKSMTAILILDALNKGELKTHQMIQIHPESRVLPDSKFSVVGLPKKWTEIPVHSALTQLLQISSNTMAMNLAIEVAGSSEEFVRRMNIRAREWGMNNTQFVNEHGLPIGDRKSEYTTASDMIILARHMLPYLDSLKSYTNAPLTDWVAPAPSKKPEKNHDKEKTTLIAEGALIKTATIDECQSLLSLLPHGNTVIADIQLCAPKYSRFKRALTSLQDAFTKIPNLLMMNANAAQKSSPPAPPSIE